MRPVEHSLEITPAASGAPALQMSAAVRAELKARYGAAVTSGDRLLTWWLLLILVLALVVEQQIRDRARTTELLSADIATANAHSREARREMGIAYDRINAGFRELLRCDSAVVHPRRRAANEMTRCVAGVRDDSVTWSRYLEGDARLLASIQHWQPSTLAKGKDDSATVRDSLRAIAHRARVDSGDTVPWQFPTFPATLSFSSDSAGELEPPIVPASRLPDETGIPRTTTVAAVEPDELDGPEFHRSTNLSSIARELDAYGAAYRKFVREQSEIQPAIERIQALAKVEQTLPTPFGGFNLDPRLALLGLTAAALLTYLGFLWRGVQARDMAQRYFEGVGEPVVPPPGAPAWIFGGEPALGRAVGWSREKWLRKRGIAIVVHACWLGVILWLVRDSLAWDASKAVRFPGGRFTAHVLAAGLALALLLTVLQLRPRRAPSGAESAGRRLGRREFFRLAGRGGLAVAVVGTSVWTLVRVLRRRLRPALDGKALTAAQPDWWYVNPRTGVLHCEPVCGDHIEGLQQLTTAVRVGEWDATRALPLHRDKEALVLESMAEGALRDGNRDLAIEHLERAIGYAPDSFRLYDRLVRVFGTADQPQYERILPLLQQGLENTSSLPEPLRARARAGFEMRIQRVAARRRKADESYRFRQELRRWETEGEPVG